MFNPNVLDRACKDFCVREEPSVLQAAAEHVLSIARRNSPPRLRCGSVCTGSAMGELVAETWILALSSFCNPILLDRSFVCENDDGTVEWVRQCKGNGRFTRCFKHAESMGNDRAYCCFSHTFEDVPDSDLFQAGFSCKAYLAKIGRT